MRCCSVGVLLFGLLLPGCAGFEQNEFLGQMAIDKCIDEYARLSGRVLDPEVDRAYVLAGNGKLDVLFARGEVGTFGERSQSYRPHLSCGVLASDSMRIYFLGEPLKERLIDVPGLKQVTESQELSGLRESLYSRTDIGFRFVAEQPFEPGKIAIEGSTTLD